MYNSEEHPAVIMDNGAFLTKCGVAGDDAPRCCFQTLVGRPKIKGTKGLNEKYIGSEALTKSGYLTLNSPIKDGIINNYDDMESIWHQAFFNELRVTPEDHPAFITEAPGVPKAQREKVIQIIFETFNVPQFYTALSPVLAFYASGRMTGVVVESGADVTYIVPIHEGKHFPQKVGKLPLAGNACTQHLASLLNKIGFTFNSPTEMEVVRDIKEKLCYVSLDYQEEIEAYKKNADKQKQYELPDGNTVLMQDQRFQCPEIFFKPQNFDIKFGNIGLPELVYNTIIQTDIDFRKYFFGNIILSGGSTMFSGIIERFFKELRDLVLEKINLKVVAPPERFVSAWIGGSILSSLSCCQNMWISRYEYDEIGATIVHRKCDL